MSPPNRQRGVLSRALAAWTYPLPPERVADLFAPLRRRGPLRARVVGRRQEADGAVSISLKPSRPLRPAPGQFITLTLAVDGVRRSRNYSLTSDPAAVDGLLEITVKPLVNGRVSGALAEELRVGEVLDIAGPSGTFVLPDDPGALLFVTAGSGVTPAVAMVGARLATAPAADIVHLHFCPRSDAMIHGRRLRALANAHAGYALHCLPTREAGAPAARLTASLLDERVPDWRERAAWLCGPPPLAEAASQLWAAAGRADRLAMEHFVLAGPTGSGGTVTFRRGERSAYNDGRRSLLEEAEQAGLAPVHGCRMGVCHSCECELRAGAVLNRRTGALIDEPGARIQPCISVAAGDVVLDL